MLIRRIENTRVKLTWFVLYDGRAAGGETGDAVFLDCASSIDEFAAEINHRLDDDDSVWYGYTKDSDGNLRNETFLGNSSDLALLKGSELKKIAE